MIAVISLQGHQYMVKKGDVIEVDRLDAKEKSKFEVQPLLVSSEDGKDAKIGTPVVEDAKVELQVLEHFKGEKMRVFKMKAKKRYAKTQGFRAHKTQLKVVSVG